LLLLCYHKLLDLHHIRILIICKVLIVLRCHSCVITHYMRVVVLWRWRLWALTFFARRQELSTIKVLGWYWRRNGWWLPLVDDG
jgi:hypothetical protein